VDERPSAHAAGRAAAPRAGTDAPDPRHRRSDPSLRDLRARARGHRGVVPRSLSRGRATRAHARDPIRFNLQVRRLPARGRRRRRPAGFDPARAAVASCSSPARSGSATRCVTSRSPRRCASAGPSSRVHWLAQDPVTRVLEARGETVHPASRLLAGESAHFESRRASTTCTRSRRGAAWTRSCRQLHGLPRPAARRSPTTSWWATRRGRSTTTCTRTPS
jgi:hypothetical protein